MKVTFASDIIKIVFDKDEPFSNRALTIDGEVISNGFVAIQDTMTWISPIRGESLVQSDKDVVCELINKYNQTSNFHIMLVEE